MVKILDAAGVDYAVLGHQEACTGDPARRAGNEMLFQTLAEQNVETLKSVNAKKVVTRARTACTRFATTTRSSAASSRSSTTPS